MDLNELIRRNIVRIRRKHDYTQERLAYESGISKGYLSEVEAGKKSPTVRTMIKLSETLGVPLYLFFK